MMRPFPFKRALAAITHAGIAASVYVLLRESTEHPRWDVVDPVLCGTLMAAILVSWWRNREDAFLFDGGLVGLKALGLVATAGFVPIFVVALAQGAAWGSVSWFAGPIVIFLFVMLVLAAIGALAGGFITSALFHFVISRWGKLGVFAGVVFSLLSLFVPAGAVATRWAAGIGVADFILRRDALRPFPVEVSAELSVRGAPITIVRVVFCRRVTSGPERRQWIETSPGIWEARWLPSIKSFGQTFSDGSGVFVITPDACQTLAKTQNLGVMGLASDYVPLVGWTPNVITLDTFHVYIDPSAFARANVPVAPRSITMRRLPFGTPESPPDTFARIGWQDDSDRGVRYRAVFATAMPHEWWGADPSIASRLDGLTVPTYGLGDLEQVRKRRGPRLGAERGAICWIPMNGRGLGTSQDAVFPIRYEGQVWTAAPAERGVLTFYRSPENRWDATLPTLVTVRGQGIARSDGRFAFEPAYIFDPLSVELWRLSFVVCDLAAPGTPLSTH